MKRSTISRRNFLKAAAMASLGTGLMAGQSRINLLQAALAASTDYSTLSDHKSLVCIYLFGGNDAYNMFVPNTAAGYTQYQAARGPLAIPQGLLHPVAGGDYGFHPSMPNVRTLFDAGQIGVLANVGTLLEPTDRVGYLTGTAAIPPDLFSHSHQTEMWQTNKPALAGLAQNGWGGEMADLLQAANTNPQVPPTITLAGTNQWQSGAVTQQMALNTYNGAEPFLFLADEPWPPWESARTQTWDNILAQGSNHLLADEAAQSFNRARDQIGVVRDGLAEAPAITTVYNAANYFAAQLKIVAQMISVREYLGMKRQLFFVALGNWDSHGNQLNDHAANLALLDDGLASFNANINELGLQDSVVSFTMSEFGRTLTVNGDGTDHGWGTHCLLMGGAVAGGTVYGQMPTLTIGGIDDAGSAGRIIPTTSLDQYAATLGKWMNISSADLNAIFPNLDLFPTADLGFIASR
ncbi:MAG: DUF1501 domain-containing protein [Gammaproteobacteria bacterium]|nr:DUF1501 domain-containing protein [Gammaproteobacteria bacterium]